MIPSITELPLAEPLLSTDGCLNGAISAIDHFGNSITNITVAHLAAFGERNLSVQVGNTHLHGIHTTYADVDAGDTLALIGSSGALEIAIRNGMLHNRTRSQSVMPCLYAIQAEESMVPTSTSKGKVLIVDDEAVIVNNLVPLLSLEGYEVCGTTSSSEARDLLTTFYPDVLVTDLNMADVTGLDLIQHCVAQALDTAVIIMTGYWSLESAVSALQLGAYDYVLKPCEPPLLLAAVLRAAERRYLMRELAHRKQRDTMTHIAMTLSHELNNPLAVVLGLVQLHLDEAESSALPEILRDDLRAIEAHIHRISSVLRKLTSLQEYASGVTFSDNDPYAPLA